MDWRSSLNWAETRELMECAKSSENPEQLDYIVDLEDHWYVLVEVAKNPHTSLETLQKLLSEEVDFEGRPDCNVREAIAGNPKTTSEMLDKLFNMSDEFSVRACIAKNLNTSITLLEELANDSYDEEDNPGFNYDWTTRKAVAQNPNTPKHIIEKLSKDKNAEVRAEAQKRL